MQIKLYLPKTATCYAYAAGYIERRFCEEYGGFTSYDARGGWVNDSGDHVKEPVAVFETVVNHEEHYGETAVNIAESVKDMTNEETVMVVIGGSKTLV